MTLVTPHGEAAIRLWPALGVKAVENGFSVAFLRFDDLLAALADVQPQRLCGKKYKSVALLNVDEVGFQPLTRTKASHFLRLVSYRYERGATLITTIKPLAGGRPRRRTVVATANA